MPNQNLNYVQVLRWNLPCFSLFLFPVDHMASLDKCFRQCNHSSRCPRQLSKCRQYWWQSTCESFWRHLASVFSLIKYMGSGGKWPECWQVFLSWLSGFTSDVLAVQQLKGRIFCLLTGSCFVAFSCVLRLGFLLLLMNAKKNPGNCLKFQATVNIPDVQMVLTNGINKTLNPQ